MGLLFFLGGFLLPVLQQASAEGLGAVEILVSILGGGGIVGAMAKYIVSQQKAHISDLKEQLTQERSRNDRMLELLNMSATALPELVQLIKHNEEER